MLEYLSIPFRWTSGSLNDNGIRLLKSRNIRTCYNYESLYAKFSGHWFPVQYKRNPDGPDAESWLLSIVDPLPQFARFCPPDNY